MSLVKKLPIILASKSPRRQALLSQIGVDYVLLDNEIDESVNYNEKPLNYVNRMAEEKAHCAWQSAQIKNIDSYKQRLLLAADTSVILGDVILGKPENIQQAKDMLSLLSDNTHQVITAVARLLLVDNKQSIKLETSVTNVTFAKLSQTTIDDYCQKGEGLDKAGSYAIQGEAAKFVRFIEGSYSGVVGLPLYETSLLLSNYLKLNSTLEQ
jgi:septum formation protein